jgi:arylamine N-acetyltransferase
VYQNWGLLADPESFFAGNLVMSLHTPGGRLAMQNDSLQLWGDSGTSGEPREVAVESEEHRLQLLRQHFGVDLPA